MKTETSKILLDKFFFYNCRRDRLCKKVTLVFNSKKSLSTQLL